MNTILYNRKEEIKNEVDNSLKNTSTAATNTTIASTVKPYIRSNGNNALSINDALFDRKTGLITEEIESFYVSMLRELSQDNALTIINYILSMRMKSIFLIIIEN